MEFLAISNRRESNRHAKVLRVQIHAKNHQGERLKLIAFTHNISSSGAYIDLPDTVSLNNSLFACIELENQAKLATIAQIKRAEKKAKGLIGMGIQFDKTRLISTTL